MIVLSSDADATVFPSGEKATAVAWPEWPLNANRSSAVVTSQSITGLTRHNILYSPRSDLTSNSYLGRILTFSTQISSHTPLKTGAA